MNSMLNWPDGFERTDPEDRENTSKFSTNFQHTKRELKKELERLGVDQWRIDDVSGSGGDPGVVLRWQKDGRDHAVACDAYTKKRDNIRSLFLWVNETRMRSQRPVVTGRDEFAAARLPSGEEDEEAIVVGDGSVEEPHEVLGLAPDARESVVRAAFNEMVKEDHPDSGGGDYSVQELKEAREAMLDE